MQDEQAHSRSRRLLLRGLAAAPALLGVPELGFSLENTGAAAEGSAVTVDQVLNVAEFEALAQAKLPPAHFGYIRVTGLSPTNLSGNYLDRMRKLVSAKFLVKGVVTGEDATQAMQAGVDGIVVSNHGGRNEETLRSTIECLPEIVDAVGGRIPVFIDGGIRRGTDIFKALALGAAAVGIGRPQVWGLAAFGQPGVEAVSDILTRELRTIMRQAGTPDLASITKDHLAWRRA